MEILVSKYGGFCPGVKHADKEIKRLLLQKKENENIFIIGQLIHNDIYNQDDEKLAIFRRRQVGLIYQFYNLIPVLNVIENITLPVLMDGQKVNNKRLKDLLQTLKHELN